MIKYLSLLLIFVFITGCCCKPTTTFTNTFSSSLTAEDKASIFKTTDELLNLLKEQKYNELIEDRNIFSKELYAQPQVVKLMKEAIPCLENHFGVLDSWDITKRNIAENIINGKKQFILTQPVHYTNKDVSINLTFVKEDNTYKVYYVKWHSKDLSDLGFIKCFSPI